MNEKEQRLAEIRKREQAATPGPWVVGVRESYGWPVFAIRDMTGPTKAEEMADAEFIQEARNDIPHLLSEVARLADENQGLRLGAVQDEGLWSSQDAGLLAEIERLTAERDAMRERRYCVLCPFAMLNEEATDGK